MSPAALASTKGKSGSRLCSATDSTRSSRMAGSINTSADQDLLPSWDELVAQAVHRVKVNGPTGRRLQFFSQLADMVIYRSCGRVMVEPPDFVQENIP